MAAGRTEVALAVFAFFFHEDEFEENSFNGDVPQAASDIRFRDTILHYLSA